ncbi:MATE family efflux transporter [Corallincola luteus]|uniref:MATE family efflux transporter n=2 Tax=Corallincola TaxID=1775176 RepID=A0A368NR70_9GAMM|nr:MULTISPECIES: MATE family efflux transporter [Corallincola]RCU52600.1 MATE family efflux transporter [Corallincola holothuriorum]TCI02497.1 MATE family efflux transporter [Corallincola luteus]
MQNLLSSPIAPTLKRMTLPICLGMVMLMSFNLVDTFFISLLGTEPLAAISFTFPVTFSIISMVIGLGIGTSAVLGRFAGQGKSEEAKAHGTAAIYLTALLVASLSLVTFLLADEIFSLLGASDAQIRLVMEYMNLWLLGSVFLALPMVGNAVFRANGETKLPSLYMALGGAINAVLDPLLIFGIGPFPEMGISGAALASVISFFIGSVIIITVLANRHGLINWFPSAGLLQAWQRILNIALPAAGANMLTPLAMAVMTAMVASYGAAAVAAYGVGTRLESIASLVVLALSMSLPPLVSQNHGAGNWLRVREAYLLAIKFVMIWQGVVYLLLLATGGFIASAFSQDESVADIIMLFILILPFGYGFQGVTILTNSSFNALHQPHRALLLSFARFFLFFVPLAYLGGQWFGIQGLFLGGLVGTILTGVIAFCWFRKQLNLHLQEA